MQSIDNFLHLQPATAALEALSQKKISLTATADREESDVTNETIQMSRTKTLHDFTDMFRSIMSADNPTFDFPEIAWSNDDTEANEEHVSIDANHWNPIAQSEQKKKRPNECEEVNILQSSISPLLRRSKSLRLELQSHANHQLDLSPVGGLKKHKLEPEEYKCSRHDSCLLRNGSSTWFTRESPDIEEQPLLVHTQQWLSE